MSPTKLTDLAIKALALLEGTTCIETRSIGMLARQLWPTKFTDAGSTQRRKGLIRSAGSYYAKLAKWGLCRYYIDDFRSGYYLTIEGEKALAATIATAN